MTSKEYLRAIAKLSKKSKTGNIEQIDSKLDALFDIKPVRLQWVLAKAAVMLKQKKELWKILELLNMKSWNLYKYPGIEDVAALYSQILTLQGDAVDARRNEILPWICIEELFERHEQDLKKDLYNLEQKRNLFLDDIMSVDTLLQLQEAYYLMSDYISYMLVTYLLEKRKVDFIKRSAIEMQVNFGYLRERVFSEEMELFIIISDENNIADCEVAATILSLFNSVVYLLTPPIQCPVQSELAMEETIAISLEHAQEEEGVVVVPAVELVLADQSIGSNIAELIHYLTKEYSEHNLATVLCSGRLMDALCKEPLLQKQMERLSPFSSEGQERNLSFGWAGSYLSYISFIYGMDAEKSVNYFTSKSSAVRYSIVIPARNSAISLRHTIKACLEIDYPKGAYEIVIGDNSTDNNMEVYNLCQELDDSRIKYYRTPRNLHLPKSFEYSFLQTRGDFILSIGSDDAVLPWALKVLDDIQKRHPQEEIIQWERGFYAWPGFNGGQQHQFVLPRDYKQDEYNEGYIRGGDYLKQVLQNPGSMYGLPMLYINSGFKRSYMKTLLEKTGRLWDGICQDIYMGVVNIMINDNILNLLYPLTIAGMTSSSIGATCAKANISEEQLRVFNDNIRQTENVGGFCMSATERLFPELRSDVSSLYNSLLRSVARGILPIEYMQKSFNWKKMFLDCVQRLDIQDMEYDRLLHYTRYTASQHGSEFLQWFDETIYRKVMEPKLIDESLMELQRKKKTYQEGETVEGGLVVDASKYGVTNIYEAVQLFQKLSGLQ